MIKNNSVNEVYLVCGSTILMPTVAVVPWLVQYGVGSKA